jgi:hypothetical protein
VDGGCPYSKDATSAKAFHTALSVVQAVSRLLLVIDLLGPDVLSGQGFKSEKFLQCF